jgi:hypothetical protein
MASSSVMALFIFQQAKTSMQKSFDNIMILLLLDTQEQREQWKPYNGTFGGHACTQKLHHMFKPVKNANG